MSVSSLPQSASALDRFRLSRFGWGRRAALVGAALIGSAALAYSANFAGRNMLWQVARACAVDVKATGSPLPCLEADPARGYAVLRPPYGRPDTILTPLTPIRGLEDPRANAPDAPNYFALAYAARRWLDPAPPPGRAALAVNSRLARSQDQLHIHIGCVSSEFAGRLNARTLGPRVGEWFRAGDMAPGLEFWTYRTGTHDLAQVYPIRLLAGGFGEGQARTTLAVVETPAGFVVTALRSRPGGWVASAEDIVEAKC